MDRVIEQLDRETLYGLDELSDLGFGRMALRRLTQAGELDSPALGLYIRSDHEPHMLDEQAAVAKRCKGAVFNLFTAARFHEVTETVPGGIWIGLAPGASAPSMGAAFAASLHPLRWKRHLDVEVGIETVDLRGVRLHFTDLHRTAVDLWRYSQMNPSLKRHHVRVHDEALHQCWGEYLSRTAGSTREAVATARALGFAGGAMDAFLAYCRNFAGAWATAPERPAP